MVSIISSEAERLYPPKAVDCHGAITIPVYTSDDLAEAYMDGAERQPTDEEIEAGAKTLAYAIAYDDDPEGIHPMTDEQVWEALDQETRQRLGDMANAIAQAMQGKATEE